jgi:hypothetical protein
MALKVGAFGVIQWLDDCSGLKIQTCKWQCFLTAMIREDGAELWLSRSFTVWRMEGKRDRDGTCAGTRRMARKRYEIIVLTRRMHQPKFKYLIVRENSYMSSLLVSRSKNCSRERWGSYGFVWMVIRIEKTTENRYCHFTQSSKLDMFDNGGFEALCMALTNTQVSLNFPWHFPVEGVFSFL